MSSIIFFDQQITQLINSLLPHNYFFDKFFEFFSLIGASIWIWLIITVVLVFFEEKKNHRFIIYFLISFLITSFLVNYILKGNFPRQRPYLQYNLETNSCPTTSSFPSGHAALAFASAYMLAVFDKKRRFYYYSFAVLVALSRIYLNCHFFLDTVGGGIIGIIISFLVLKTIIKPKQFKKRLYPRYKT